MQKTHKASAKRFWKTGSGKLRRRRSGQDHFNSRAKRSTKTYQRKSESLTYDNPRIAELIPYK
ncbi:MAG: hypothetical protein A2722_04570 [Candidatus Doudnabacteria bacterium RIFCSPHIGHO2_01_FULL_50_11]|uniref:50S ribosomal protein L35 n=1 Tax=Candidatus Doudnabacteria bacterium RIFCSPHIGHO2_01_FULL_50_11 TaxID=1817828 RepID=A0A1F5PJJ7_9BACT|nr:MAG: hypothetical protein A2722_04570 [Candidatus Doudnabacteria bacterium RIFCSPHIGHO2_01_FULL_50_11]HLC45177.1 50S ribosomal protein L35 [Patescibacteria group bacterium]